MTTFNKVAVAGATGNLGPAIVKALLDANFQVVALSRSGKTDGLPSSVKTVQVDYTSQSSLVDALKSNGVEAVVSNLPKHDDQPPLIDAAIEAGVKRFLPSDFGSNISGNANVRKLPVFQGKVMVQDYLNKRQDQIENTVIVNGVFLDWALDKGFLINKHGGPTALFDDPNDKISSTTLADVGKAVSGVLLHPSETKNKTVYVQSTSISQNELMAIAKKVQPQEEFSTEKVDTEELLKTSLSMLEKGEDIQTAMFNFLKISIFNKNYGSDWNDNNDNALLGIKELSEEELENLVKKNL